MMGKENEKVRIEMNPMLLLGWLQAEFNKVIKVPVPVILKPSFRPHKDLNNLIQQLSALSSFQFPLKFNRLDFLKQQLQLPGLSRNIKEASGQELFAVATTVARVIASIVSSLPSTQSIDIDQPTLSLIRTLIEDYLKNVDELEDSEWKSQAKKVLEDALKQIPL